MIYKKQRLILCSGDKLIRMNNFSKLIILFFSFCFLNKIYGQNEYIIKKSFLPLENILIIDSLPIDYNYFKIFKNNIEIGPSFYDLNHTMSSVLLDSILLNDTITINYKTLNPNIKISLRNNKMYIPVIEKEPSFFKKKTNKINRNELYTNGSFVRNFSNGNNKNLSINTDVDLRISGKINDDLFIDGVISDNSLPLQYGESSSSLQDLDKVYIKLYNSKISLTGGDIEMSSIQNHFLKFSRKSIGLNFSKRDSITQINSSIGLTKNIFKRQTVAVESGNQGPYKLVGQNNEPYILIISDSESVYIDGFKKKRGTDKDYIINYNTGEISFTSENILNENNRVIIEFQYTNQDYFKWIGYGGFYKQKNDLKYYINFYTENDNKNSPINPLSDQEISLLNNSGDNLIYLNSENETNLNPELQQILYEKKDTIDLDNFVHESIFIFSNNIEDTLYKVTFSNVGSGNGNYILESSLVNGAVFKWISPAEGISQGNYSPTKVLIPPKRNQMISFGGIYTTNNTNISVDIGISNTDQNLFSEINDKDNVGFGTKLSLNKIIKKNKTSIIPSFAYEYISQNFSFIERTRDLEFDRNWGLSNNQENNQLIKLSIKALHEKNSKINYSLENRRGLNSNKIRNSLYGLIQKDSFIVNIKGSLLNSISEYESINFLQHKNSIQKKGTFNINISNEGEVLNSTNSNSSFNKLLISQSIENSFFPYLKLDYINRIDKNELLSKSEENTISLNSIIIERKKIKSNFQISYSDFSSITNDSIVNENSLITKADYFFNLIPFIKINGIYELSTGQEALREIRYVKVNQGYGTYSWIDYNNNNIEEYDEFEISHFSDTADYMKISFPTNEYIDVKNARINQQLRINPTTKRIKGLIYNLCLFENLSSIEINRKTTSNNWSEILSPFYKKNLDNILSLKFNFNNTLIYQPKNENIFLTYKVDKNIFKNSFSWDQQLSESLSHKTNFKFIFSHFTSQFKLHYSKKKLMNENLLNQNYLIKKRGLDLELLAKYNNLRPSLLISYFLKENKYSIEDLNGFKLSSKLILNEKNGFLINTDLTFYHIKYKGELNSSISYQMLDGLMPGNGLRWGVLLTKKINKLVFSFKYSGETNSVNDIHYAQIEFKKYF